MFIAFLGGIFVISSSYSSIVYDIHKEQRGGRSEGHKTLANFTNGCALFWGKGFLSYSCGRPRVQLVNLFLSVICKGFLHLFGFLVLYCFLKALLIYCSIIETKEVQRLITKVGSIDVCLLFCQFYYTYETCKTLCALVEKKSMFKYIDLTVEA